MNWGALLGLIPIEIVVGIVTTLGALIWGALGKRKARREGERAERDRVEREIMEADHDTAQDIRRALDAHVGDDRDAIRRRLRRRLDRAAD